MSKCAPMTCNPSHPCSWNPIQRLFAVALILTLFSWQGTANAYHLSQKDGSILLMQATADQYIQFIDQFSPGYRLKYFNAEYFAPFGDVTYSAVFEPNTEGWGVSHQFGISWGVLTNQVAALQGTAEMMQVDSYNVGNGEVRYAYIAYHKPEPAESFVIADVNASFIPQIENGLPSEWKVVNRTYAGLPANATALYKADNTLTIAPHQPLFFDTFEALYAAMLQEGFRLTSLEVMNEQSAFPNTYLPVFKSDGNLLFSTENVALDEGFDQAVRDESDFPMMNTTFVSLVDLSGGGGIYDDFPAFFVGWRGQAKLNSNVLVGGVGPTLSAEPESVDPIQKKSLHLQKRSR